MLKAVRPHHVGLTVPDLDRARDWYTSALDMEIVLDFDLPEGARGAMLQTPAGARVELFEVPQPRAGLDGADPATAMRTRGFGHVAFEVDDLDGIYEHLVAAGADPVWDPRRAPEPGKRMAFIHDPYGNLIELIGELS